MSIPTLPINRRAELRAEAHALKPVVLISENGLTPAVLREIDLSLVAHTLIKIRIFSDDRVIRQTLNEEICERLQAALVQQIGKICVLYRHGDAVLAGSSLPGKMLEKKGPAPRDVVVRKPAAANGRKPKAQKVKLLGNQRVTAGGNIKRAKPRQVSAKKRA